MKALILWKYNRITGLWNSMRTVTEDSKRPWLLVYKKDEPNEHFKVSKIKPRGRP